MGRTASPPVTGKDRLHARKSDFHENSIRVHHGGQGHGREPCARGGDPLRGLLIPGKLKAFESTRIYMLQRDAFGPLALTRSASLPSGPEEEGARRKRGKLPA